MEQAGDRDGGESVLASHFPRSPPDSVRAGLCSAGQFEGRVQASRVCCRGSPCPACIVMLLPRIHALTHPPTHPSIHSFTHLFIATSTKEH